jgi:hypothetical protein
VPLFEGRDPDLDLIAVLSVFQLNWLARCQSLMHLVELVTISAQPANEIAIGDSETLVEAVTLPARVENRAHHAVFAAREHEANQITGRSAVAEEAGRTAAEIGGRYGYEVGAMHAAATRREHRSGGGSRSNRERDNKQNCAEFREFHALE